MNSAKSLQSRSTWLFPAVLLVLTLFLFRGTAGEMVQIWTRSETFQHAFLVIPIAVWLTWRKRDALLRSASRPEPWLLVPMGGLCVLWLLGDVAEVAAASQLALVGLVVLGVLAFYGWEIGRVLAFPLLFLFFLVPFGEFAVPALQDWTANMTVLGLQLTGVPVYREGMQFVIPTGAWSVVAACSGLSYTISLLMVGVLFAYFNYNTFRARLLFVATALLVSILANWIRAYTIVMIGHLTGSPLILGVEHTVYGWFLFGFIVMIFFFIASRWTHAPMAAEPAPMAGELLQTVPPTPTNAARKTGVLALGIVVLLCGTHFWSQGLQDQGEELPPRVALPDTLDGWTRDDSQAVLSWKPGFLNPTTTFDRAYTLEGQAVHVWVGYYGHQSLERKLVTSSHRVVSNIGQNWRSLDTGIRSATVQLPAFYTSAVSEGLAPGLTASRSHRVWHAFWFDGGWYVRPSELKVRQALERVRGGSDSGAVVMLITEKSDQADQVLERFASRNLPTIGALLANASEPAKQNP